MLIKSRGSSWTLYSEPLSGRLVAIDFVSPAAGWGIVTSGPTPQPFAGGSLVRTVDGGVTWSDVSTPAAVQSVCAADAAGVWAAGGMQVFHSTDAGATWSASFSLPPAAQGVDWIATVRCAGSAARAQFSDGVAAGHHAHVMYRTLDGASWAVMMAEAGTVANFIPASPSPGPYPGAFSVVDARTAFVMGWCPVCDAGKTYIRGTTDGGTTWTPDYLVFAAAGELPPVALDFVDASHGWALFASDSNARVLATADGGVTWTQQYP